ncbi:MAG: 2-dehydropantoate 2-reductase [Bacteroidota bacterium]|nr:2-dehydropantoate 2-reductase [Bacteroidota bacterium]
MKKTRIGILGVGGVGGYFGGLLAERYFNSADVEVIFIVRPSSEKIIKEKGLKLITPQNEKIIFPSLVTSKPDEIGELDYLICTVKSYDLAESLIPLKNSVKRDTILLPLLNGVDSKEIIKTIFPEAVVLDGCVYIVSRLIEPGVVKETGNIHTLYFGSEKTDQPGLKQLERLFLDAGIECFLCDTITSTVWEKFIFISSIASLTSYLNLTIGAILSDGMHKQTLLILLKELKLIADARSIGLQDDVIEKTLKKMGKLPFETTSSMHSDFKKGGKTEYRSLTEYVVKCGNELNIETPGFDRILEGFLLSMKKKV